MSEPAEHALDEDQGLIQFFQHAHHRVEGWLLEFQEALGRGRLEPELFTRAAGELRAHMFVEEEIVFPLMATRLARPVADLHEEHGHLWDLVDEMRLLVHRGSEPRSIETCAARLLSLLSAHSAEEDLGVYSDVLAALGQHRTRTLLAEAEAAEAPAGWVCQARRGPPGMS